MTDGAALKVMAGDKVRVHYHPPSQVMSFAEGAVSRVSVTTTRGRGFLIDISREVFLGREQPVKPGYEHYVLYEQLEDFPEKLEVMSQVQRELGGDTEHGSEAAMEQRLETEIVDALEPEPKPLIKAEQDTVPDTDADGSAIEVEHQDGQRRGGRIISLFRQRRK